MSSENTPQTGHSFSAPNSPCSSSSSSPISTTFCSPLTESFTHPTPCHFIGKKEDIIQARRVTKLVNGCRDILVLYHQGALHAMDLRCYHAGGPLKDGDIEVMRLTMKTKITVTKSKVPLNEEFNGQTCIVCPWHKYKITLAEGESLYEAVDNPTAKPLRTRWCSKGVKQRVHKVTEVNGNVYVTLNDSPEVIESDTYQTEKYRATFCNRKTKAKLKT